MAESISKKIKEHAGGAPPAGRSALVAESPVVAGLLNMAEAYMSSRMREPRVFNNMDEAIAWVEEYYLGEA